MHEECISQILLCFAPCHAAHGRTLATFLFGRIDWQPIKRLKADKPEHAHHTHRTAHTPPHAQTAALRDEFGRQVTVTYIKIGNNIFGFVLNTQTHTDKKLLNCDTKGNKNFSD